MVAGLNVCVFVRAFMRVCMKSSFQKVSEESNNVQILLSVIKLISTCVKSILRKVRENSNDDQILPSAPNVQSLTLGQLGSAHCELCR